MNDSGDNLTVHCCQVVPAVKRLVIDKLMDALQWLILYDGYYGCGKEVWQNFILYLRTQQFVSHNPFGLMRATIIRDDHLVRAVWMMHYSGSMTAAATVLLTVTSESGNHLVCSAMLAGMTDKGISKAA
jgi:hypothetical protein